jgi:hypothetical protein
MSNTDARNAEDGENRRTWATEFSSFFVVAVAVFLAFLWLFMSFEFPR